MKNMHRFGDRLRLARKRAGFSQEGLANAAAVSQGVISKIERGDQEKSTYINEFAKILGCNAYWLETGKEEPETPDSPDLKFISDNFPLLTEAQQRRLLDTLAETLELNRIKSDRGL